VTWRSPASNLWCLMTSRCLGGLNCSYSNSSDTLRKLHHFRSRTAFVIDHACAYKNISLTKQQFVLIHSIRQNTCKIPALLVSAVMNTPSVKMLCPQRKCSSLCFLKKMHNMPELVFWGSVKFFFSVSNTIVHRCVTTNRCFISDIINPPLQLSLSSYS
jgi:hypothetical protein